MVVVVGDVAAIAIVGLALFVGKRIPDARAAAAFLCCAFDLVGRGRGAKRERLGSQRPADPNAKESGATVGKQSKAKEPKAKPKAKQPKAKAETEDKPPKTKAKARTKAKAASTQAEKPSLLSDSDWEAGMKTESEDSDNVPEMCEDPVLLSGFDPEGEDVE